jgi:ATP-dependent Clp protease adapter protein ClpS
MRTHETAVTAMSDRKEDEGGTGLGVATRTRTRSKTPSPYKVLMLNDDYTPMEFVVHVLQTFFKMSTDDATRVMLHVISGGRRVRHLQLRGGRDQGEPGHRLRAAEPAPAAVHARKA